MLSRTFSCDARLKSALYKDYAGKRWTQPKRGMSGESRVDLNGCIRTLEKRKRYVASFHSDILPAFISSKLLRIFFSSSSTCADFFKCPYSSREIVISSCFMPLKWSHVVKNLSGRKLSARTPDECFVEIGPLLSLSHCAG